MGFGADQHNRLWDGIIFPGIESGDSRFEIFYSKPRSSLKKYISIAWLFKWNIPQGQELPVIALPTPVIKVGARLGEKNVQAYGPKTVGMFRSMSGSGMSLGFDLVPGGLYPFWGSPVDVLVNSETSIEKVLPGFPLLGKGSWSLKQADEWFQKAQDFLESLTSEANHLNQISLFFSHLWDETEASSVGQLAEKFGTSKRSVQRIFLREIGMSPREAIRITRLHKALRVLSRLDIDSLVEVSTESGFFDQSHMTKEFKAFLKASPNKFKKFM